MQQRSPISPRNQRLSVIAEDGNVLPPILPAGHQNRASDASSNISLPIQNPAHYTNNSVQTSHRPQSRKWTDKPPHHSAEPSPPRYEHWDENTPQSRLQVFLGKIRGNREIAKRGGWKRLLIILIILLAVIIALAVGLGVGLSQRNKNNSSNNDNGNTDNSPPVFPEGSFAIPVYSAVVNTGCTSIPNTWLCYPYSTYNPSSPSSSQATYNWIITSASSSSDGSSKSYNISTSSNPFADMFSNIPLTLENVGTADEHYAFTVSLRKSVVPTTSIAPEGQTTTCYYNNTTFRGMLYTRKASMNITGTASTGAAQNVNSGTNSASMASAATTWESWPYAVNVTQQISGGQDVPECYILNGDGSRGERVTQGLTPQDASRSCVCGYRNFGF